jgi:hypothetical protein
MSLIKDVLEMYKRHLGEVFMYAPSTMRDGERVTAEEVRIRASELENAHGGVYSVLAGSLQKPLGMLVFEELGIKNLESQGVVITITTGVDALSRGNENDKINHWLSDLANAANIPEAPMARLQWENFMKVTAAGRDIEYSKFIMNEADYQKAVADAQQQETAQQSQVAAAGRGGQPQQPPKQM